MPEFAGTTETVETVATTEVADAATVSYTTSNRTRLILVGMLLMLAFLWAYGFASARSNPDRALAAQDAASGAVGAAFDPAVQVDAAACGSGGCCGAGDAPIVEGSAVVEGPVQVITVDVADGYFNPGVLRLQAGVPTRITFGQGSGCMAEVMFKDFGVFESLTQGGATIDLPALEAGEYAFSCGMEMVFGTLVVE